MTINRRIVLQGGAAALAGLALPRFATASIDLGGATLTTVSDGYLTLPGDFIFAPMPQEELTALLAEEGISRDSLTPDCNVTLYQDGTNTVLFDVGSGPDFMPSAGTLIDNLDAAGVAPDDVTHVVFTHAHPDHIWGLLDDFDDLVFANATYLMGRDEWAYWYDPATVDTIGEARAAFAVGAKRRMEVIEDQVQFFDDGQEVLPGIAAMATYGHTPGHMAFELRSGSESALIVGDAIVNHHVAFLRPGWLSGSDQDTEMAATTRQRLLDRIASEQMRMIGFHLPGGGIGRAERTDNGYRFVGEDM